MSGIEFIQFKRLLQYPELKHAYILKTNEMNFKIGKDFRKLEKVKKILKNVSEVIGIEYEDIVRPNYEHTNIVQKIDALDINERPSLSGKNFKNTDGLITIEKNIALMSTNADCSLMLIYDPIKKVIGNVHAGWKGCFNRIVQNAINEMKKAYNSDPKDIICCFCPSIRKCHFEVDEDVANVCKEKFSNLKEIEEIIIKGQVKEGKQKYYIDMSLINKILLKQEGVLEENIIDSEICSVCNNDKVHSKRAEGEDFDLSCALIEKNKI